MNNVEETSFNFLNPETRVEGKLIIGATSRIQGSVIGQIEGKSGSTLILTETAMVEGNVEGDVIIINGFVRGDVKADTRVHISATGRVIGNIQSPALKMEFGAYFEGRAKTESLTSANLSPVPA